MAISEENQLAISFKEGALVNFVLGAAIQDDYGNWETALCFLEKALKIDTEIALLQSICDEKVEVDTNIPVSCDVSKKGIGVWAIGTPASNSNKGCSVITIPFTNVPPPYGEFKRDEFKLTDFTKIIE